MDCLSPTQLWFQVAKEQLPKQDDIVSINGRCALCGAAVTRGLKRHLILTDSFTGYNQLIYPASDVVCEACVYALRRYRINGKLFTPRNYSHYIQQIPPRWDMLTKKDIIKILQILFHPSQNTCWGLGLSETGQKHLLPYIPINSPGTNRPAIFLEDMTVEYEPSNLKEGYEIGMALYNLGFSRDAVATGQYPNTQLHKVIKKIGIAKLRELDKAFGPYRKDKKMIRLLTWLLHKEV